MSLIKNDNWVFIPSCLELSHLAHQFSVDFHSDYPNNLLFSLSVLKFTTGTSPLDCAHRPISGCHLSVPKITSVNPTKQDNSYFIKEDSSPSLRCMRCPKVEIFVNSNVLCKIIEPSIEPPCCGSPSSSNMAARNSVNIWNFLWLYSRLII